MGCGLKRIDEIKIGLYIKMVGRGSNLGRFNGGFLGLLIIAQMGLILIIYIIIPNQYPFFPSSSSSITVTTTV